MPTKTKTKKATLADRVEETEKAVQNMRAVSQDETSTLNAKVDKAALAAGKAERMVLGLKETMDVQNADLNDFNRMVIDLQVGMKEAQEVGSKVTDLQAEASRIGADIAETDKKIADTVDWARDAYNDVKRLTQELGGRVQKLERVIAQVSAAEYEISSGLVALKRVYKEVVTLRGTLARPDARQRLSDRRTMDRIVGHAPVNSKKVSGSTSGSPKGRRR